MAYNESMKRNTNPTDNINTEGMQLYMDAATVVASFWNKVVLVKIHPAKPEGERTQNSIYDYNKQIAVALSPENAVLLGHYILNDIMPAIKAGEECTRAIVTNRVNMLVVSTGVKMNGSPKPYIGIFKNIDESRKPGEFMVAELRKGHVITEYNHTTGDFASADSYSELYVFGRFLETCTALLNAGVHADKFVNRFLINRGYEFRNAVSNKLGIETNNNRTNYVNRNTAGGGGNNLWDTPTPADTITSSNDAEISTASIDSLSDLI